jgi:hypothetical protein
MLARARLIAVLALVATATAPGAAQEPPAELQSWRVPGWSFTPGVSIGAVYDTNAAILGPDPSGHTPSDSLVQVDPFGQLEFFSARTSFSSGYHGSLRRYAELTGLDGLDHRMYASLRHRLTRRVSIFLDESYQRTPTTDVLQLSGVPFQRTGTRYNLATGGIEARLTRSLDLMSRYENSWVDFIEPTVPLSDGVVQGVQTSLTRRLGARTSLGGEYLYHAADLNDGLRKYVVNSAGGVFRYRVAERTSLDLAGGMSYLIDRARDERHSDPYVRAALLHHMSRATVGTEYRRSYSPSFTLGGSQRSHQATAFLDMPFRRNRFYLQESVSWRRADPLNAFEPALDSTWLHSTLGYALRRWLRVEGYHTFSSQDNSLAGGRVTRHLAGVQLIVSEPMRIR